LRILNSRRINMHTEEERKVLERIEKGQTELLDSLATLVSFKTVTPSAGSTGDGQSGEYIRCQEYVAALLKEVGIEKTDSWMIDCAKLKPFPGSGVIPDRDLTDIPVLVGVLKGTGKGAGKSMILNGHYDVVSPGEIENWSHDPFKASIEGNKLFGRGACDMKGGIAAMIFALKCIRESGLALQADVIVESVPEEELTSMGTLACCQKGYKAQAALIPEPTDLNPLIAMRGNLNGKITVFGRAGHGDMPQPHWSEGGAVNAISKAVKILQALDDLTEEWRTRPDKQHKLLPPDMVLPTLIHGGKWIIMYPEKCEIEFNSDFIPSTKNLKEEIDEKIRYVAGGDSWMREHPPLFETNPWLYGAEIDENDPIVKTAFTASQDIGHDPKIIGMGSLTDAIHLINYAKTPTVTIGPGGGGFHEPDEFVYIDSLLSTAKIVALCLMRWCGYG
jgi:acetylornithine deacetylase